jgi:putative DNA primase/helicase
MDSANFVPLNDLPFLLRYIPASDRDTWVAVGMGIKAEFGTNGWDAWDTWSQSGTGYRLSDAKSVWRSFKKSGTGMGTVIKMAMDNGWRPEKKELTKEDKRRFAQEQEARRRQRQAEIEADEARARRMANEVGVACARVLAEHCDTTGQAGYLARKQVEAFGLYFPRRLVVLEIDDQAERCQVWAGEDGQRWLREVPNPRPAHLSMLVMRKGDVVISLGNIDRNVSNIQVINGSGKKLYAKYGTKQGSFHVIGALSGAGVIGIGEGYATCASVHMAAGWPMVVTFDAGNLLAVARQIRQAHPAARLVFCGDDDIEAPGNPGRAKAEAAALELGGVAVFPEFVGAA